MKRRPIGHGSVLPALFFSLVALIMALEMPTEASAAGFTVPLSQNLGSAVIGNTVTKNLTVTNLTAATLAVTIPFFIPAPFGVNTAQSSCLSAGAAAGGTCTVAVTFTPTTLGASSATLSLQIGAFGPVSVSLTGNGTRNWQIPVSLNLAGAPISQTVTKTLTITNIGNTPLTVTTPFFIPAPFGVDTAQSSCLSAGAAAGGTCTVAVTFTPTTLGASSAILSLQIGAVSPVQVSLIGNGTANWQIPSSLNLAGAPISKTVTKTLTITNIGGAPLTVTTPFFIPAPFGVDPAQSSCLSAGAAAGGTCTVAVTFTPTALGASSAILSLQIGAVPVQVSLSGSGTANWQIPVSVSLGSSPIGNTISKTLTITNIGSTLLTVTTPFFIPAPFGVDPAQSSCLSAGAAAGGTCAIAVTFTPTALGASSATLSLQIGAVAPVQVSLSGSGKIDLTVTPLSFLIPNTLFGATINRTVTVTNHQLSAVALSSSFIGANASDFNVSGGTCTSTLGAQSNCTMIATFRPGVLGPESATLNVADSPDPASPYAVSFTVAGTIPIKVVPTGLSYGNVTISSSKTKSVAVTNLSSAAVSIGEIFIVTNVNDFSLGTGTCGPTLAGNATCTQPVIFRPTVAGAESALMNVTYGPAFGGGGSVIAPSSASAGGAPVGPGVGGVAVELSGTGIAAPTPTATATASATPTSTPTVTATPSVTPTATPTPGIFVTNVGNPANSISPHVSAYLFGSDGNVTPSLKITDFRLADPAGIKLDPNGNICVINENGDPENDGSGFGSINVYPPTSNGASTPSSQITGDNTTLSHDSKIAIDSSGNIYVLGAVTGFGVNSASDGGILIFPFGANGDVAPTTEINGPDTRLGADANAIAVDSSGNIYVAVGVGGGGPGSGRVVIFAGGSSGDAAPIATIEGADTGLSPSGGLALDSSGNILVLNSGSVTEYPPLATLGGQPNYPDVAPIATIQGSNTGLDNQITLVDLAVDSTGRIYVVNEGGIFGGTDSIIIYAGGSNGNVAPAATISGPDSGLSLPHGIAVRP